MAVLEVEKVFHLIDLQVAIASVTQILWLLGLKYQKIPLMTVKPHEEKCRFC
jgi:hypothetical protein